MNRLLLAFVLITTSVWAEDDFPGINAIMTPEEFHRAGLDQLSPEQIATLNSAIVRHYVGTVEIVAAKQANVIAQQNVAVAQQQAIIEHEQRGIMERFGLPSFTQEWKEDPGIGGTVTSWVGGNSFKLDNGQVWEGQEPIPFELVNKKITIKSRPNGMFALEVEGQNTTVRIRRVK